MELKFKFLGRSCWYIEVDKKFKIACDPSFDDKSKTETLTIQPENSALKDTALWLITECNSDSFDESGAKIIDNDSKIIARKECGKFLRDKKNSNIYFLDWFKKKELDIRGYRIIIEVIPTYKEGGLLSNSIPRKANGYFVTIIDKENTVKRIYITGNTIYQENIIKTLIYYPINILIANIGYIKNSYFTEEKTMDLVMLNSFIRTLNPEETVTIFSKGEKLRKEMKKYIDLIEVGEEKEL